jgi:hypothetical protein
VALSIRCLPRWLCTVRRLPPPPQCPLASSASSSTAPSSLHRAADLLRLLWVSCSRSSDVAAQLHLHLLRTGDVLWRHLLPRAGDVLRCRLLPRAAAPSDLASSTHTIPNPSIGRILEDVHEAPPSSVAVVPEEQVEVRRRHPSSL